MKKGLIIAIAFVSFQYAFSQSSNNYVEDELIIWLEQGVDSYQFSSNYLTNKYNLYEYFHLQFIYGLLSIRKPISEEVKTWLPCNQTMKSSTFKITIL